jgi:phosphatidylserine decarboxylase
MTLSATENRIHNTLPIAREGIPFILITALIAILFYFFNCIILGICMTIITLFILYFFRDPERTPHSDANAVLSPADGKILEIRNIKDGPNPLDEPAIKISIFMSVFNVHVNRIPITGKISRIIYRTGRFFSANLDKASEQNEKNIIALITDTDHTIVIVQIAGLIARRIVYWIKENDHVQIGQRFGLIRFGSRVELYVPEDSRIVVQQGDRVKAGKTLIGYLS